MYEITWETITEPQREALRTFGNGKRCFDFKSEAIGTLAYCGYFELIQDDISQSQWYAITEKGRNLLAQQPPAASEAAPTDGGASGEFALLDAIASRGDEMVSWLTRKAYKEKKYEGIVFDGYAHHYDVAEFYRYPDYVYIALTAKGWKRWHELSLQAELGALRERVAALEGERDGLLDIVRQIGKELGEKENATGNEIILAARGLSMSHDAWMKAAKP